MGHATPMATMLMIMMITVTRNDNVHFIVWVFAQSETNNCHILFEAFLAALMFFFIFIESKNGEKLCFYIKIDMHHFIVMSLTEEREKKMGKTRKM